MSGFPVCVIKTSSNKELELEKDRADGEAIGLDFVREFVDCEYLLASSLACPPRCCMAVELG